MPKSCETANIAPVLGGTCFCTLSTDQQNDTRASWAPGKEMLLLVKNYAYKLKAWARLTSESNVSTVGEHSRFWGVLALKLMFT